MKHLKTFASYRGYDHVLFRSPIDMDEGGDIHPNSERLAYQATARVALGLRRPMPTPVNQSAITSDYNILHGYAMFPRPQAGLVYDAYFYSGLLNIDNQEQMGAPKNFEASGKRGKTSTTID